MKATIGPARTRLVPLLWLLLTCALLLLHGATFDFVVDDAYISYRYAQNLVDGHGLVFNPGEPVEGYSNLLWVLLVAAGLKLGVAPLVWTRLLGGIAMVGLLALLPGATRRLLPDPESPDKGAGPAAQVFVAATGAVACWTLAGLETPLFALLTVAGWRSALARKPLLSGVIGVLLILTRPDGLALAVAFAIWSLLPGGSDRATGRNRWAGPLLLISAVAAHLLWRHAYYGYWLPNTYYAKTGDLAGQVRTGLPYGLAFLASYALPVVLAGIAAVGLGAGRMLRHSEIRLSLGLVGVWFVYTVVIGGDMLGMFRFQVPLLPVLTTTVAALLLGGTARMRRRSSRLIAIALVAALLPASVWGQQRRLVTAHMSPANLGGWRVVGDVLAAQLPPGATLALGPAGYIPWRTGARSYDFYGLVDPVIAHRDMAFTTGYAGHEKHDGALVIARRPDYIMIGNVDLTRGPRTGLIPPLGRELDIVTNPDFQRDYEQVAVPLGGGLFLNMFRRRAEAGAS